MAETDDLFLDVPDDLAATIAAIPDEPEKVKKPRTRKDPTEPRTYQVWHKFVHVIDGHCSNLDCIDPRPQSDDGRNVVARLAPFSPDASGNDVYACRFCFLAGYPKEGWHDANDDD